MSDILKSPYFGIVVCVLAYRTGFAIQSKVKLAIANPLLIAIVLIIGFLTLFQIPLSSFQMGSNVINGMLAPITAVLAISIYRQLAILKKQFWPIFFGCLAGTLASMLSVYALSHLLGLTEEMLRSLIPKSATTAIAIEVSRSLGGISAVTVAAVIITGIIGYLITPLLLRIFHITDPVVAGVAIGTSSHALGTTRAVEIGEIEGAMSSVAIGITGIFTVVVSLFL